MNISDLADRIYNGEEITFYTNKPDIFNDTKMTIRKIHANTYNIETYLIGRELFCTFEGLVLLIRNFKPCDYLSRDEI